MSYPLVTLLLGSNLGNPEENIKFALNEIEGMIGPILRKTAIIETEAVEFVSNNIFCNIAIIIETQFSPIKILEFIKTIEREMGRIEDSTATLHYTDRIIDIDIVEYGNVKYHSKVLVIPHTKHLYERDFSRKLLYCLNTLKT